MCGPLEFCSGRFLHSRFNPTMASLMSRSGKENRRCNNMYLGNMNFLQIQYNTSSKNGEYIALYLFSQKVLEGNFSQVVQYIKDGNVLECPENTPKSVYKLMTMWWSSSPSNRPCFRSESIFSFTADADGGEKLQGSQLHTVEFVDSLNMLTTKGSHLLKNNTGL